jgi:hypothetical protein
MKRRTRRTLNFLAFNLLFFSLYLNFIYKDHDKTPDPVVVNNGASFNSAAPKQVVNAAPVVKHEVKGTIN